MSKFRKISLLVTSLFFLVSSAIGQAGNTNKSSFQNKNLHQSISALLADEGDDVLDTEQVFNAHALHFVQLAVPLAGLPQRSLPAIVNLNFSTLPFYLKIQNLRI